MIHFLIIFGIIKRNNNGVYYIQSMLLDIRGEILKVLDNKCNLID